MMRISVTIWILVFLLMGCSGPARRDKVGLLSPDQPVGVGQPSYAKGFTIHAYIGGYHLRLMDPWNSGEVFQDYWIGDPDSMPPDLPAQVIPKRVKRIALSSTTHAGFIEALGQTAIIVGSTNPERLYHIELSERYQSGMLQNLGRDMDFNMEALLDAEPDLILQTSFEGQLSKDKALLSIGIPVLYIQEWMEPTPLGRAEWIKVVGLVTGELKRADSLFRLIEGDYQRMCGLIDSNTPRIKVLSGNNFKGTWFIPGGANFMTHLYRDAGMTHPWDTTSIKGSLALSFETVYNELADAEVWLGVNVQTGTDLVAEDSRCRLFDAFKSHRVFSLYGRENENGGNDFWESGVVFPNRVLADLISISHPGLLPDHQLIYYKKLVQW